MSDSKHAPLPWSQYCGGTQIYGGDRFFIGVVQSKNAEVDTAFIVKACNVFYDNEAEIARLRAALEDIAATNQIREFMGYNTSDGYSNQGWVVRDGQYAKIARSALSAPVHDHSDGNQEGIGK